MLLGGLSDLVGNGVVGDAVGAQDDGQRVGGAMTEFVHLADWRRDEITDPDGLTRLSLELAQTPCSPLYGRHISPDRELTATLAE